MIFVGTGVRNCGIDCGPGAGANRRDADDAERRRREGAEIVSVAYAVASCEVPVLNA